LDVVAKAHIREFLLDINRSRGVSVVLTTHDMNDVEALCPRMVIVDHGRKLYDGLVAGMIEKFGDERTLVAELDAGDFATLPRDEFNQPSIPALPQGVRQLPSELPTIALSFTRETLPAHELVGWVGAHYHLRDVTFKEPEIEGIIRRIYENGLLLMEEPGTAEAKPPVPLA
jgi:ABC-2 type transport system ATP-binding protein